MMNIDRDDENATRYEATYKDGLLRAADILGDVAALSAFQSKDCCSLAYTASQAIRAEAEQQPAPGMVMMTNDELAQAIEVAHSKSRGTCTFETQHKLFVAHLEKLLAEQYRRAAQEAK